jgi:DNA adenine methylase
LGDINADLMQAYEVLATHPRLLAAKVHAIPATKRQYYKARRENPEKMLPLDRAARFIYLNRYCFNGVYRTNRAGRFNVPRGSHTGRVPDEREFYRCSVALRNAELRAGDFEQCLVDVRKGDFVYLDPPYTTARVPEEGQYGYQSLRSGDLTRVIRACKKIDEAGAHFVLSYHASAAVLAAFPTATTYALMVRRNVAGYSRHRRTGRELVVTNVDPRTGASPQ